MRAFLIVGLAVAAIPIAAGKAFTSPPKAGQDYELILLDGGQCLIALQRLNPTGKPENVAVEKAKLCNAMDMF